jgi:hypothetical protein
LLDIPEDPRLAVGLPESPAPSAVSERDVRAAASSPAHAVQPYIDAGAAPSTRDPMSSMNPDEASQGTADGEGPLVVVPRDAAPPLLDAGAGPPGCIAPERLGPNGGCYVSLTTLRSWSDARLECRARGEGWDLAALRALDTDEFVSGLITAEAWVGASDDADEGWWRWVPDGAAFWNDPGQGGAVLNGAYVNWNADEPNGGMNSDCLRIVPQLGGRWADLECASLRGSVCEGPAR